MLKKLGNRIVLFRGFFKTVQTKQTDRQTDTLQLYQGSLFLKESERSAREEFYRLAASREEFVLLGIVLHLLGGVRCK